MVRQDENTLGAVPLPARGGVGLAGVRERPAAMWLFLAGAALLYAPTLIKTVSYWVTDDNYAHGFFVFPISLFLLWIQRDQIRDAPRRPTAWGLAPLALGLLVQTGTYLLQIKYVGMWSLPLTLAGGVLLVHGPGLWRIVRFPVLFLLFAGHLPNTLLATLTGAIQQLSTVGAATIMDALGFTVMRHGNLILVPGATLEVATACSGFHTLISLLAFATLYGYLFTTDMVKRSLLLAAAVPIALLANMLRIAALVIAADVGGTPLLHHVHDPAEIAAILFAFLCFVLIGRRLGCRTVRFSQLSAA